MNTRHACHRAVTFLSSLVIPGSSSSEVQWCFSQVKGTLDDDVTEADIISCVEFNQDGDLLATGDKGGRVVIFQRDPQVGQKLCYIAMATSSIHLPTYKSSLWRN